MKKWEYLVEGVIVGGEPNRKRTQDRLDNLGEQGWDVCGTLSNECGASHIIFKRELEK